MSKNVYTIPAGVPFAKALAARLLEETKDAPEQLTSYRIFLPTRRACRTMRETFLALSDGQPLLLPRLQPLGDIDEDELSLNIAGTEGAKTLLDLKPGISPMRRRLLLAKTITNIDGFAHGFDHAIALADALGHLMDQIHTEGLDMAGLADLAPEEFAGHWQITLEFLKILSEHWPKILEEENLLDIADRRNRLIRALSAHWLKNPPQTPVIAAGSTGSIPATAELLDTIAALPQGSVVLPGLDREMDETSWNALQESHPQYGFKNLLDHLGMERGTVQTWPCTDAEHTRSRQTLAREVMRPAETSGSWTHLSTDTKTVGTLNAALADLSLIESRNEREEAEIIAVLLRETLENKNTTAALITPDRNLARRVGVVCRRWGITLDDSAGQSLDQTQTGIFLRLCLEACISEFAPVSLLSLLKHPLCRAGMEPAAYKAGLEQLERYGLRGLKPEKGFAGLYARLEQRKAEKPEIRIADAVRFLKVIEPVLDRFNPGSGNEAHWKFRDFLKSHIEMAEALAGRGNLWRREDGEAAASFLAELSGHANLPPPVTPAAYADILEHLMKTVSVRPAYGTHPRLMILGQLEARLVDADLVILSGLNEGTWPPEPGHDPWMSRPMRKTFGLPSSERGIGLAAHDFVQGLCMKRVIMTRAIRVEGAPTVPARWLQRLETVLDAAKLPLSRLTHTPAKAWAEQLNMEDSVQPCERPAPRPPVDKRPVQLSVTQVETWQKDPYGIYARHILKLKKLEPLEQPVDAAVRGTLLHDILDDFVSAHKDEIPGNANAILQDIAAQKLKANHDDPAVWSFWWPRFERLSGWYTEQEKTWRTQARPLKTEVKGRIEINSSAQFTLTAKADRIDRMTDGSDGAAVIDYKSGGSYSESKIRSGETPQLSLEALILKNGGYEDIGAYKPYSLSYWIMTGGTQAGEIKALQGNMEEIVREAEAGLKTLITCFADPQTPYYSLPRPDKAPRFNDYEHLARVREWGVAGDQDSGELEAAS